MQIVSCLFLPASWLSWPTNLINLVTYVKEFACEANKLGLILGWVQWRS